MDPSSKGSLPTIYGPDQTLTEQFLGLNFNDLATAQSSARTGDNVIYASAHDNSRQIVGTVSTTFTGPIAKVEYYNNIPNQDRLVRERLEILQWLAPSDQWHAHTAAVESREPDTGLWFLDGDLFKQWLEEPASLLWIYGGVGCGKTVLCSSIIQKLLEAATENESSRICFFYCSFQDHSRQDLGAILRSFIAQFCTVEYILAPLQKLYIECQKTYPAKIPTNRQLSATLIAILQELRSSDASASNSNGKASSPLSTKTSISGQGKEIFLFIDALDEIPVDQREEVFEFLNSLAAQRLPHVRILLTSRYDPSIKETLTDTIQWPSTPIDTTAVETDIDRYVRRTLESHHSLQRQSDDSKKAIISRLVKDSNGMFRWAALQIEMLKRATALNHSRILTLLSELPKDLNETYARILADIKGQGLFRQAYIALLWLATSTQPMWIEDLVEACAIRLDRMPVLDRHECQTPYNIVEMLHDLVRVQPPILEDAEVPDRCHIVALAHFSVQEFLTGRDIVNSSASSFGFTLEYAHDILARSCLSYLYCYNSFSRRHERFSLREYAWYNWEHHISVPGYRTVAAHEPFRRKAEKLYHSLTSTGEKETPKSFGGRRYNWMKHISVPGYVTRAAQLPFHLKAKKLYHSLTNTNARENETPKILGGIFPSTNHGTEDLAFNRVLDWMPVNGTKRLKDSLNIPYFHPSFDIFGISSEQSLEYSPLVLYIYRPLDHSTRDIRLFTMLPSLDQRTQIRGQMIHAPLDHSEPYVALSYVWGSALSSTLAGSSTNDHLFIENSALPITSNLADILRRIRLRSEFKLPVLWVDALCINMWDREETRQQVTFIGSIYQNAQEVLVGLGNEELEDENGILAISKLASLSSNNLLSPSTIIFQEFRDLVLTLFLGGESSPILRLFDRYWWIRRWVIQEIIFSSKATLLFGNLTLNFDIISQVMKYEPVIRTILSDNGYTNFAALLQNHPGWQTAKNMTLTRSEFRTSQMVSFPRALYRFRSSKCFDPRDAIYALLTFSVITGDIIPNYEMDTNELFIRVARYIMEKHRNLDILSLCSAWDPYFNHIDLPSWVPNFYHCPPSDMIPISLGVFGERAADSALFTTGGAATFPLVSASSNPAFLILQGIVFDSILLITKLPFKTEEAVDTQRAGNSEGQSPATRFQSLIRRIPPSQTSLEALWRTVMSDQWEPGERLGRRDLGHSKAPPTTKEEEAVFLAGPEPRLDFAYFRNLAITSKGYAALVPGDGKAEVGDIIAVMPGGAVPYVVRPREGKETYKFIGECYVHGIMDGEVLAAMEAGEGGYHFEEFILD